MRVAVLSDIHGNLSALLRVLEDAVQKEDVDQVWCLGDVVGYGPYGLECYDELRKPRWPVSLEAWVAGNHDWGLAGRIPLDDRLFRLEAEWALRQTKILATTDKGTQLRFDEMCAFLAKRPTFAESPQAGVWLMHGRVTDDEQGRKGEQANVTGQFSYIWDRKDSVGRAEKSFQALCHLAADKTHRPGLILAGHTHQPLLWHRSDNNGWHQDRLREEDPSPATGWLERCPKCGEKGPCRSRRHLGKNITLPSEPVLINPGSVGQPRDGCPAAAYVILDFEMYRTRVTFKRLGYDIQATMLALARLARKADGESDPTAMRTHVRTLRNRLTRGE